MWSFQQNASDILKSGASILQLGFEGILNRSINKIITVYFMPKHQSCYNFLTL